MKRADKNSADTLPLYQNKILPKPFPDAWQKRIALCMIRMFDQLN